MQSGLHEQLINKLILSKIAKLDRTAFYIKESKIDKAEAANILSQYLLKVLHFALSISLAILILF